MSHVAIARYFLGRPTRPSDLGTRPAPFRLPAVERRAHAWRRLRLRRVREYALIILALVLTCAEFRPFTPSLGDPAVMHHPQFGELYRRALIDPHEDCLVVWWETAAGAVKFRSSHCPSPLKAAKPLNVSPPRLVPGTGRGR